MLMQTGDGDSSILYRADADGSNLARVLKTINRLEPDQVADIQNLAVIATKPAGEPREILLSLDMTTGQRVVRSGVREVNDSGAAHVDIHEGADDSVYFCAVDGTADRIPTTVSGLTVTPPDADLWRTDGSPENTRKIIAQIEPPAAESYCGYFAVGTEKIYYTRGKQSRGARQAELWSANLDGTDQKPLLELGQFSDLYPNPLSLTAMPNGGLLFSVSTRSDGQPTRRLARAYPDGRVALVANDIRHPTVLGWYANRFWVHGYIGSSPVLWSTNGNEASTARIAEGTFVDTVTELSGDIYYLANLYAGGPPDAGLYKLPAGSQTPELVKTFEIQTALNGCCAGRYQLSGVITDLQAFNGDLVFIQRANSAERSERVVKLNLQTGEETVLLEFDSFTEKFESLAVFNGSLYIFKHKYVNIVGFPQWEILKSAGEPGDAVSVYSQTGGSVGVPAEIRLDTRGEMKNAASALWFFAPDERLGNELWRLTP